MDREEVSPRTNGKGNQETPLTPNLDMAVEFLRRLHPNVQWRTLIAIIPDGPEGTIQTRSFADPADWCAFISAHNKDRNLYYNHNPTKMPMNKRAKKEHIGQIIFILADCDPNKDESPQEAKDRYLATVANLPRPTVAIDSGNGIQFLWRLNTPLGPEYWRRVEAISKALMLKLGTKAGTQDISRILRLPGTINHPTKTKLAAGRKPCMSEQLWFEEHSYVLDDFLAYEKAAPEEAPEAEADGSHEQQKNLDDVIKRGRYELFPDENGKPDRSRAVWWVANEMQRRGYAQSAMMSVLLDKTNRISEHVYDQGDVNAARRYAAKQISDAWIQLGDAIPRIRSIEIRPGQVETFKVTIGNGTVVVDAEALNDLRYFNRASIAQTRRSFAPMTAKAWNSEVDRALRAAKEPVPLAEEQIRFHGTDTWPNEPMAWLVRERLPEQGVGLLSGQYSAFKTFVMLDLAGCVMTGLPFLKARITRRGGVLIFAAEGTSDLTMRVKALIDHRLAKERDYDHADLFRRSKIDLDRLPFGFVGRCRPLLDPKTVDWMIIQARVAQEKFLNQFGLDLVLIGIDTMSAAAGWENENDAAQAQIVMNHLADVSKATKTFVLAADHFGKNLSAGTRGSVVKEASADTMMVTLGERDEETNEVSDTRLVIRKQRYGPQGEMYPFEAVVVAMGEDSEHEPLTSRVINWDVERVVKQEPKAESQLVLEEALTQTFQTQKERIRADGAEVDAVQEKHLRAAFRELYLRSNPGVSTEGVRIAHKRAFKKMNGLVSGTVGGIVYLWYPPAPF